MVTNQDIGKDVKWIPKNKKAITPRQSNGVLTKVDTIVSVGTIRLKNGGGLVKPLYEIFLIEATEKKVKTKRAVGTKFASPHLLIKEARTAHRKELNMRRKTV